MVTDRQTGPVGHLQSKRNVTSGLEPARVYEGHKEFRSRVETLQRGPQGLRILS